MGGICPEISKLNVLRNEKHQISIIGPDMCGKRWALTELHSTLETHQNAFKVEKRCL